jgi:acyl carrier protein
MNREEMNSEKIYEHVVRIFVELFELKESEIHPDAAIFDELGLDSLDMVDLAVEMQARFGFEIQRSVDEEKLRAIRTIKDLCLLVEEKIQSGEIDVSRANS